MAMEQKDELFQLMEKSGCDVPLTVSNTHVFSFFLDDMNVWLTLSVHECGFWLVFWSLTSRSGEGP